MNNTNRAANVRSTAAAIKPLVAANRNNLNVSSVNELSASIACFLVDHNYDASEPFVPSFIDERIEDALLHDTI